MHSHNLRENPVLLFGRVGREELPDHLRTEYKVLSLRLGNGRTSVDFNTDVDALRTLGGSSWNASDFDLLNVMCALRAADRYFVSEDIFRVQRTVPLAVGVSNRRRWSDLGESLVQAVRALSSDVLDFHPVQLPKLPASARGLPEEKNRAELVDLKPDCVCLFSGGVDSFTGAAYLLSKGRRPLLVSHSVGPVSGLQKRLVNDLSTRFPAFDPRMLVQVHSYPNVNRIRQHAKPSSIYWKQRESLQRLRSTFFFSIAAIVANVLEIDEIFMCENGLIGAAIVFAPCDNTPYTPRPAEPHFLRAIREFLSQAIGRPNLKIRNPFQYMTKGEVVTIADRLGLRKSLYATVSCWQSGNRGIKNCGRCVPCLFRQLAFSEAGLPPPQGSFRYRFPIPFGKWRGWKSQELPRLEDIRRYCNGVLENGVSWLNANELAVIDAVDVTGGSPEKAGQNGALDAVAPSKMAKVIERFASATLKRLP